MAVDGEYLKKKLGLATDGRGKGLSAAPEDPRYVDEVLVRVRRRLMSEVPPNILQDAKSPESKIRLEKAAKRVVDEEARQLGRVASTRLVEEVISDLFGYGPIQPLVDDEEVTEIMVNGPEEVWVEKDGKLHRTEFKFRDANHVLGVIERIVGPLGRRVDESSPMVDARLPDGSRVNAIIPPLVLNGPCVTIRKFGRRLTAAELIERGTLGKRELDFLSASVRGRLNILVSGGTGSGKTTLLNVLSGFIPPNERVITIEDAAELYFDHPHWVRLEARPANVEGKGEIPIRQLVKNALRMRPNRIVVGEVRAGEALDMLQAMNTGHDGSLGTAHANSPADALRRLETMVLMAGENLPLRAIREQLASSLDLIVHVARLRDGSRKITCISEVGNIDDSGGVEIRDLFRFRMDAGEGDRIYGRLEPTGEEPSVGEKLALSGVTLDEAWFAPGNGGG